MCKRLSLVVVLTATLCALGCEESAPKQAAASAAASSSASSSAKAKAKPKAPPPFQGTFKEAAQVVRTCKLPCARESVQAIVNFKGKVPKGPAQFVIFGCASLCEQQE